MNTIPTAEEFCASKGLLRSAILSSHGEITNYDVMIEFARMHVKAALRAARNNAELLINGETSTMPPEQDAGSMRIYDIDEKSILNAYPLENIK